jgi:hypothetical protein
MEGHSLGPGNLTLVNGTLISGMLPAAYPFSKKRVFKDLDQSNPKLQTEVVMKRISILAALALVALGCQESTSTGPATPPVSNAPADASAGQKKLTVMALESHTVKQGDTDNVMVTINRDNFNDPVTLAVEGLPTGVTGTAPTIAAGDSSATIVLKAEPTAAVGEHSITLTAQAPGLDKNTQQFTLKVVASGG